MKKFKKMFLGCCLILASAISFAENPSVGSYFPRLDFSVKKIYNPNPSTPIHRTPPVAPIIYIDVDNATLYSEAPLYDCTVNLVSEFGEVLFSTVVPDEATEIQLPTMAPGVYELQIVRGDYIFYCEIEF